MTDAYHPFSDAVALVDLPVSRCGSLLLLFIDPEDARLVEASTCPSGEARLTSSDASEATEDEPSSEQA